MRVTVDNFGRAETDTYFAKFVKDGGFGKFNHERELAPIDNQTVIRLNRDTLYSFGVFDLDAAPVTVTLPDAGKRYMAMQVINEDHYAPDVFYAPGAHTFTKEKVGTRYVALAIRTFVNPNDPADVKAVHALQDAHQGRAEGGGQVRGAGLGPGVAEEDPRGAAGARGRERRTGFVADVRRGRIRSIRSSTCSARPPAGAATRARRASTRAATPKQNDGKTAYRLTVKDVPVDGFWSVSVYNKDGFFEKNAKNAYTLNNVTAKPNADGSVTIQFGGDENAPNYLPIMPGWNYLRPDVPPAEGNPRRHLEVPRGAAGEVSLRSSRWG